MIVSTAPGWGALSEPQEKGLGLRPILVWKLTYLRKQILKIYLPVLWFRLLLPMQGVQVQSLVDELRSHIPHGPKIPNVKNRSNVVTHSIKTLKIVHIKKFLKKKKNTNSLMIKSLWTQEKNWEGFPGSTVVKNLPATAGDAGDSGSIPGWGRSTQYSCNSLQYSCGMENSRDRVAWQATQSMGSQRVRHD